MAVDWNGLGLNTSVMFDTLIGLSLRFFSPSVVVVVVVVADCVVGNKLVFCLSALAI